MSSVENIKVFCRVRPLNEKEINVGCVDKSTYLAEDTISLSSGRSYTFNKVFPPNTMQLEVYNIAAKPIIKDVFSGYNGTIFAYGRTSSGKTHTMEGILTDEIGMGLIPRIVKDIFIQVNSSGNKFEIKVSHLEIHVKKIRDLLVDEQRKVLKVCEGRGNSPYVSGLTEVLVNNESEMMEQLIKGSQNRKTAWTSQNIHSSRSHSIFQISIQQVNVETKKKIFGKLLLIDLAGSEKVTKMDFATSSESKYINTSLSALTKVISSLARGEKHIPFRDSQLTHLLKESLGGNSRTTMIICMSPASEPGMKSSLDFGCQAQLIRNNSVVNEIHKNKWKTLWEKTRVNLSTMTTGMENAKSEIKRWRIGERVPEEQWISFPENIPNPSCESSILDYSYSSVLNKSGNTTAGDSVIESEYAINKNLEELQTQQKELFVSKIQEDSVDDSITRNKLGIGNMNLEFEDKLLAIERKLEDKEKEISDLNKQNNVYKAELTGQQKTLRYNDETISFLTLLLQEETNKVNSLKEQEDNRNFQLSKLINEEMQLVAENFKAKNEKSFRCRIFNLKKKIRCLQAKNEKVHLQDSTNCEIIESFTCFTSELKNTNNDLRKQNGDLNLQLSETKNGIQNIEEILQEARNYSTAQETQFENMKNEMEKEKNSLLDQLSKHKKDLQIIAEGSQKMHLQDSTSCEKVESLTCLTNKLTNTNNDLSEENRVLSCQLSESKNGMQNIEEKLQKACNYSIAQETQFENIKNEMEKENNSLLNQLSKYKKDLQTISEENQKMHLQLSTNCERIESLTCFTSELTNTIDELKNQNEDLNYQLSETKIEMQKGEEMLKEASSNSLSEENFFKSIKDEIEKEKNSLLLQLSILKSDMQVIIQEKEMMLIQDLYYCKEIKSLTCCVRKCQNEIADLGMQNKDLNCQISETKNEMNNMEEKLKEAKIYSVNQEISLEKIKKRFEEEKKSLRNQLLELRKQEVMLDEKKKVCQQDPNFCTKNESYRTCDNILIVGDFMKPKEHFNCQSSKVSGQHHLQCFSLLELHYFIFNVCLYCFCIFCVFCFM